MHRWIAWAGFFLLFGSHVAYFPAQSTELMFGWMPVDLVYRLVWMVLAWLYLMHFTAKVWGPDGEVD